MGYNVTADGRDLSKEEWRRIPGFKKYMITQDGDVKNIRTGKLLTEVQMNHGSWAYCVWTDAGKSTYRTWQSLMWDAFPEHRPEPKWKESPTYPWYQVAKDGTIRNKRTRNVLRLKDGKVRLKDDNKVLVATIAPEELVKEVWGTE